METDPAARERIAALEERLAATERELEEVQRTALTPQRALSCIVAGMILLPLVPFLALFLLFSLLTHGVGKLVQWCTRATRGRLRRAS